MEDRSSEERTKEEDAKEGERKSDKRRRKQQGGGKKIKVAVKYKRMNTKKSEDDTREEREGVVK